MFRSTPPAKGVTPTSCPRCFGAPEANGFGLPEAAQRSPRGTFLPAIGYRIDGR
jgi:hypothetical protein